MAKSGGAEMSKINTVNVKGLQHEQRQQLIFSNLESAKSGEAIRLVVDKNPLPLVYALRAGSEFKVTYEKEGPDEWILRIEKTGKVEKTEVDDDKKMRLKELLDELKKGDVSEELKEKAKKLFNEVDAKTLGLVEQELIEKVKQLEKKNKTVTILFSAKDKINNNAVVLGDYLR